MVRVGDLAGRYVRRRARGAGPLGHILTPAERANIQIALADAFVDRVVDYASIAERIQG